MTHAVEFVSKHAEFFSLLGLAFVATMPDDPPASFRDVPGWLYRWIHGGLKTFTSFRGPKA